MREAPDDSACNEAWNEIMRIARDHALVVGATGGTATLAIPERQREAGIREKVLRMHVMTDPPRPREGA